MADASHELRTPLTALRLRLETGDTDAAVAEVERLARLVDELLALARADASGAPAAEALDLGEVVAGRVELWAPYASEHGVELDRGPRGSASCARRRAGSSRCSTISLRTRSTPLRAGSAITVSATAGGELHVVDEGPGLDAEQRERAFDRFWRASAKPGPGSASRSRGGSSSSTAARSSCARRRAAASTRSRGTRSPAGDVRSWSYARSRWRR